MGAKKQKEELNGNTQTAEDSLTAHSMEQSLSLNAGLLTFWKKYPELNGNTTLINVFVRIHQLFTTYKKQMHNIFNIQFYVKTPTYFYASMHHRQGVLLLYRIYKSLKIQSISTYT